MSRVSILFEECESTIATIGVVTLEENNNLNLTLFCIEPEDLIWHDTSIRRRQDRYTYVDRYTCRQINM